MIGCQDSLRTPFSWRQFEPGEGVFDELLLKGLIERAKKEGLRIAILWLATWKNGYSGYAPAWLWEDPSRFPQMSDQALSPFGSETLAVDQRAFCCMMELIKKFDPHGNTVVMVQVENELGLLGDSRDRSALAEASFLENVPLELTNYLEEHETNLKQALREAWIEHGRNKAKPWVSVFGGDVLTDEIFMAWHMANFTNAVAKAGKSIHPLPMFVNAWTVDPCNPMPGVHPSGGPVASMLDVWYAAAPEIDLFGVDNYRDDFKNECREYQHCGNPLFIPEAAGWWGEDHPKSAAAKAFYSFGSEALAYSPFGIENDFYQEGWLAAAYEVLRQLEPLMLKSRGRDRMRGFYRQKEESSELIKLGSYEIKVHYALEGGDEQMFETGLQSQAEFESFGLIIQETEDTFVVAGRGFQADFHPTDEDHSYVVNLGVEEGEYDDGGHWKMTRILNGDEVPEQGTGGVKMPPSAYPVIGEPAVAIQRIKLLKRMS